MKHALKLKVLNILDACQDLTVATLREDGFPQATTVSFVHDGLTLFFGTGHEAQKARNMRRDPRVSITMTAPYGDWNEIRGLSLAGHAEEMTTPAEAGMVMQLMVEKFPQIAGMATMENVEMAAFRITPMVISVLDYTLGFGHTDTVRVSDADIAETLGSMQHKWLAAPG